MFSALDPTPAPSVLAVKHGKVSGTPTRPAKLAKTKAAKPAPRGRGHGGGGRHAHQPRRSCGATPAVSGGKHARPEHGRPAHADPGHPAAAQQSPVAVTAPVLPAPVTPAARHADPSGPGNGHGHAYGHDKA